MPLKAPTSVEVPRASVPTWLFGHHSQTLPDDPIILDPEAPDVRYLSLSSYRRWSQRLAKGLREIGVSTGDRVLFVSGNDVAYPVVLMGVLMAGAVLSGVSPASSSAQLTRQAAELAPAIMLASADAYQMTREVGKASGVNHDRIFLFDGTCLFTTSPLDVSPGMDDVHHWKDLLLDSAVSFDWSAFTGPDQIAAINYTSGSTGDSKGVMVSHSNLVANALQYIAQQQQDPLSPENGHGVTWVMWTPMYHVIGQTQFCITAPKRGIKNYIMQKLVLRELLRYIDCFRATDMLLTLPTLIAMLHDPVVKEYNLSSIKNVNVGGAPLRHSVSEKFRAIMPNRLLDIKQGWGMTEVTAIVISPDPNQHRPLDSVGKLLPNCEAKVMTPDGLYELDAGKAGELWVRSPNVTKGYLNRPDLTNEVYRADGWLRTGDFGYYDHDRNWFVRDRMQDVIHAENGAYALPTDLESVLLHIPGVKDAGVTAMHSNGTKRKGPRGFVVLDSTVEVDTESVKSAFIARVQPHEYLTHGLFEIKEIPRLPSGKVHRVALRDISI